MKKNLILLFPALLLCLGSCSKDYENNDCNTQSPFTNVEEALTGEAGAIRAVEEFIVGLREHEAETRTMGSFKIGNVTKRSTSDYKGGSDAQTRSVDESEIPVYELILESENNTQGYAVVLGNTSQDVIAFAPEGCIADTIYNKGLAFWFRALAEGAEAFQREEEVDNNLITRGAPSHDLFDNEWSGGSYYIDIAGTEVFEFNNALVETPNDAKYSINWYYTPMLTHEFTRAHVPIAWHQEYPYNMMISARKVDGTNAKVGCFGIAASSIIAHHAYLPGYEHLDWKKLTGPRQVLVDDSNMYTMLEAALLCKAIAEDTKATQWIDPYTGAGSTSQMSVEPVFNKLNYHIYEGSFANNMARIKRECQLGRPMMIGASSEAPYAIDGHIWVIDGYYTGTKYHSYTKRTTKKVGKKTMYSYDCYKCKSKIEMLHMIWGFKNNSNGWYANLKFQPWGSPQYNFKKYIYLYSEIYPKK